MGAFSTLTVVIFIAVGIFFDWWKTLESNFRAQGVQSDLSCCFRPSWKRIMGFLGIPHRRQHTCHGCCTTVTIYSVLPLQYYYLAREFKVYFTQLLHNAISMFMHAAVRKNHPRSGVEMQNQCVSRSVSVGQCRRKNEILCRRSSIIITLTADGDPHAASTHKHRSTRRSSSLNHFGAADRSVGQFIHRYVDSRLQVDVYPHRTGDSRFSPLTPSHRWASVHSLTDGFEYDRHSTGQVYAFQSHVVISSSEPSVAAFRSADREFRITINGDSLSRQSWRKWSERFKRDKKPGGVKIPGASRPSDWLETGQYRYSTLPRFTQAGSRSRLRARELESCVKVEVGVPTE